MLFSKMWCRCIILFYFLILPVIFVLFTEKSGLFQISVGALCDIVKCIMLLVPTKLSEL